MKDAQNYYIKGNKTNRDYMREKINQLVTNSKNKNIRDLYRGKKNLRGATNIEVTILLLQPRPQVKIRINIDSYFSMASF
jgi:hypothetical protein